VLNDEIQPCSAKRCTMLIYIPLSVPTLHPDHSVVKSQTKPGLRSNYVQNKKRAYITLPPYFQICHFFFGFGGTKLS
jgi:hypothetical protein